VASLIEVPGTGYGAIYTSTDSGASWTQITNLPPECCWTSVSSSADGTKLAAVCYFYICISTNSGTTWTANEVQPAALPSVASSADGTKLVAGLGWIYTSADSGVNWTYTNSISSYMWSVACSADGARLVAAAEGGLVYTSYSIPTPQMSITPASNSLTLSWIIPSCNFALQQNSDLTTANWINVTNTPVLNLTNLQNQTTLPSPASNCFFRLKSQ